MSFLSRIPTVLVHKTPSSNVPSILQTGLLRDKCDHGAVYLALHAGILDDDAFDGARYMAMDTLYVDVTSIMNDLRPDPEWRSEDNHNPDHLFGDMAWYVLSDIDPKFISTTAPDGYQPLDPFRP